MTANVVEHKLRNGSGLGYRVERLHLLAKPLSRASVNSELGIRQAVRPATSRHCCEDATISVGHRWHHRRRVLRLVLPTPLSIVFLDRIGLRQFQ
jgi:hypothetical protein